DKVKALVKPELRDGGDFEWCVAAEYLVNKAVEEEIRASGSQIMQFHAKKGDILIWHAKLGHRGSIPQNPDLILPAVIPAYSNIRSRRDIGNEITRHGDGGYFWEFSSLGEVLSEDKFSRADAPNTVGKPVQTEMAQLRTDSAEPDNWFGNQFEALRGKFRRSGRRPRGSNA